jgi:antitoxin component YwqK of YwqJK toxin-antitoxin module
MQDKKPTNKEGEKHGYWEVYFRSTGTLEFKGLYVNGKAFGKIERYWNSGKLISIIHYINSQFHGYSKHHFGDNQIDNRYYAR